MFGRAKLIAGVLIASCALVQAAAAQTNTGSGGTTPSPSSGPDHGNRATGVGQQTNGTSPGQVQKETNGAVQSKEVAPGQTKNVGIQPP